MPNAAGPGLISASVTGDTDCEVWPTCCSRSIVTFVLVSAHLWVTDHLDPLAGLVVCERSQRRYSPQ